METRALEYLFRKDRLPTGWSYPLKRSVLDDRLRAAGVTSVWSVRYRRTGGGVAGAGFATPLRLRFDPEDGRVWGSGQVSIVVYAVPSSLRRPTMTRIEENLAAMCDWILGAQFAAPTWRMTGHELRLEIRDSHARVLEERD